MFICFYSVLLYWSVPHAQCSIHLLRPTFMPLHFFVHYDPELPLGTHAYSFHLSLLDFCQLPDDAPPTEHKTSCYMDKVLLFLCPFLLFPLGEEGSLEGGEGRGRRKLDNVPYGRRHMWHFYRELGDSISSCRS